MITYFDLDADGYRTAKGSWTVRYIWSQVYSEY
jgi:hypothetical protein